MRPPRHIVVDAGHKDGVLMRDFGRFGTREGMAAGVRSLLVECGYHYDLRSRRVAQDQSVRFLAAAGGVDDADLDALLPHWRLPDAQDQWILEVTSGVVARGDTVSFTQPFQGLEAIATASARSLDGTAFPS